jgi:hypothetical protein
VAFAEHSPPDRIGAMNLLGTRLVARLLLSFFVAHDALVGTVRRFGLWLRHALLAAMFAALILHTFQIVLSGHRHQSCLAVERLDLLLSLGR